MSYITLFSEKNEELKERYELIMSRISEIKSENSVKEPYRDFFVKCSYRYELIDKLVKLAMADEYRKLSEESLVEINKSIYDEIANNYDNSYSNPDYAIKTLGEEFGKYLMVMAADIEKLIEPALSCVLEKVIIKAEEFVEIYNIFENEEIEEKSIKEVFYWFEHDYSEVLSEYAVKAMLDPECDFATSIIMDSDLSDSRYLYFYGEYISENEIETSKLLNSFDEEKIEQISMIYASGFINGFMVERKNLFIKKALEIRYPIGFERVVRSAIKRFSAAGLKPVIRRVSYLSTPANKQFDYDHRFDQGLWLDKCIKDIKVEFYKKAFKEYKELASLMAGPAVIEAFGEKPFSPQNKESAIKLDEKQQQLNIEFTNEYMQVMQEYIKKEERSFTIIAYPIPEIGEQYKEIFDDINMVNTLDQSIYRNIQQNLIYALDKADYVEVKGRNGNRTDIKIKMHEIENRDTETLFENCLADINIPLGEVFTSPKLAGTTGKLHVSQVYLKGFKYIDLELDFEDGVVKAYSCKNFDEEMANKTYIKENLLYNHETLPMGEFAIGTNTMAYMIGRKYDIINLMPILIVEKMGPHFAVGDTCFSREEDKAVYNPDGRMVIAKSNEISDLRKTDIGKAYFNCHTDITIPYDELGSIIVVSPTNARISLIEEGRFVLSGTEKLNEALDKN